ncbi:MAG: alkaline phosphatase family protein [Mycobacterium sp.]|nr:alkaline phosphatase family protein [Mycobacterium sp.]
MEQLIVLCVAGLSPRHMNHLTPNIAGLARRGGARALRTVLPAVTCTMQSSILTGLPPNCHGAVANGWYFRDLGEIHFWRQSARLIAGERVWEEARRRDPSFTCANLFWWYAMHGTADISVTPRPMYLADGRKLPDIWASPPGLREELTTAIGEFPLFQFWGPATSIASSRWIASCALHVRRASAPTLTLVYLPHLDYDLQRTGPDHPTVNAALHAIDGVCGELIADADRDGARVIVLSEYGIGAVDTPIHINRALREAGFLRVRKEVGGEHLDLASSSAFAVADHQIAHVYVQQPNLISDVAAVIAGLSGVERVAAPSECPDWVLDHPRSGELIALAARNAWFTYYHWLDDNKAPDYARTVDIHRKPGYDPVELFFDPAISTPKLSVGWRLARRALGLRVLMDVIPLDARLVRGSHGRPADDDADGAVIISSEPDLLPQRPIDATEVKALMLDHMFPKTT